MERVKLKKEARNKLKGNNLVAIIITLLCGISVIVSTILLCFVPVLGIILYVVVMGTIVLGFYNTFLKLSRDEEVDINDLTSKRTNYLKGFLLLFLKRFFVRIWSLLLVIPGIVAMYEYSLAYYIFLDDPDISITEAINLSKDLMKGHKMDMFILDLSFILWYIASLFTFGLLLLYVIPYQEVTKALFYNQIINEYLDEQEDI